MLAPRERTRSRFTKLPEGCVWARESRRAAFPRGCGGTRRLCWCNSSLLFPQIYTTGKNGAEGIFIPILGVPTRNISSSSASEAGTWKLLSYLCSHNRPPLFVTPSSEPLSKTLLVGTIKKWIMFLNSRPPLISPKPGENPIPDDSELLSKYSSSNERSAFLLDTTNVHHCSPPAYTLSTFTSFKPLSSSESPGTE